MTGDREGTLGLSGRDRLHFRARETEHPRGRLLAVHGLGEHSGRLNRMAGCAAAAGLDYFALDLRGHGRSVGRRGHADSFDELLSDFDAFRRHTCAGGAKLPVFLLGHSLGGLLVGRYVQEYGFAELAGIVMVAPFVDLSMRPPAWKLLLGDVANRLLPSLSFDSGIRADMLFRTTVEAVAHEEDPLIHHRISARMWSEMRRNAAVLVRRANQSRVPALVQLAGDDRVVSTVAAREYARVLGEGARVVEYEGAFHDLYRDPLGEAAAADLVQWINGRLETEGGAGTGVTL